MTRLIVKRAMVAAACGLSAVVGTLGGHGLWPHETAAASTPAPAAASPTPVTHESITEDDPHWNCLTMGNHRCGPDWVPVDQGLADALAEDGGPGDDRYPWESCRVKIGDTTFVACPDGRVMIS